MVGAGTIVASALVNIVCNKLSSLLLEECSSLWGVEKDLKALEKSIKTVKLVLGDAENRSGIENHVYEWLRKLKEIVYDADDLLDELYIKAQRSRDTNRYIHKLNVWKRRELAQQIKSINTELDAIASEKDKFHLNIDVVLETNIHTSNQETWSIIDEDEIYGRDHEKEELISHLMKNDDTKKISIISIVGLGGLGKTTLAQLVYNNEHDLKDCFNLRMWVYVSQIFYCERIVKKMIEQITKKKCDADSLESLGEKLLVELKSKKFLLVLDNVWDESIEEWKRLKSVFKNCEMESKIIVTTRSERVSEMMEATYKINLKGLSEDESRELFNRWAFRGSERRYDSRYLEIADKLIKKCGGVPLALINLGSTMSSMNTIGAWKAVKDDAIWKLGDDSKKVMQCLKLSYMHLPSYLKDCFTFCAIFPKGKKINKLELIGQWIAHDLIDLPENNDAIEEMGNEYFKALVQRSFLQNVVTEIGEETCTMHDLVHDLARSILGPEFLDMKDEVVTTNSDSSSCRYLSLISCSPMIKSSVVEKVRAVHIQSNNFDVADTISKMKKLRSLVLESLVIDTLPKCLNLIHLRYICFIRCRFPIVPDEIGNMWNLQALHLNFCTKFMNLPESVGKLVNLRTLELINCYYLKSLPESTSQCRHLRNLVVRSCGLESIPNSIGQLAHIRLLDLSSCSQLKKLSDDILEKSNSIRSINLRNCGNLEKIPASFGNLKSLESLDLSDCRRLKSLPESIGNLCNLQVLNLSNCYDLKEVPISFGNLKSLKNVDLSNCLGLESLPESMGNLCDLRVLNLERLGICTLPSSIHMLVNLVTLSLNFTYQQELPRRLGEMKKLMYLHIEGCPLDGMPIGFGNLTNLRRLSKFVVARKQGDNFASISELKDMKSLSGSLEIYGLKNLHNPIEAEHADLKHKQNLDSIKLKWDYDLMLIYWKPPEYMIEEPLEYDWLRVLEALQPPSSIKSLTVEGFPGSKYPDWMMLDGMNTTTFPNLKSLTLSFLCWCSSLPCLVNLSHLRSLKLTYIKNLTIVDGYFPSMIELELSEMPKLEKVITMKFKVGAVYEPMFPRLSKLSIHSCPKLRMQPHLQPSIVELMLRESNEEILMRTELSVGETSQISPIPLRVRELTMRVMKLTQDCTLLGQFNSLRTLEFWCCELVCLPNSIRQLSSLLVLDIDTCECLQELPEWLGELKSLQELLLEDNYDLSILPRSMKDLTQLRILSIRGCTELKRRYNRENGEDWHLISHIPCVLGL